MRPHDRTSTRRLMYTAAAWLKAIQGVRVSQGKVVRRTSWVAPACSPRSRPRCATSVTARFTIRPRDRVLACRNRLLPGLYPSWRTLQSGSPSRRPAKGGIAAGPEELVSMRAQSNLISVCSPAPCRGSTPTPSRLSVPRAALRRGPLWFGVTARDDLPEGLPSRSPPCLVRPCSTGSRPPTDLRDTSSFAAQCGRPRADRIQVRCDDHACSAPSPKGSGPAVGVHTLSGCPQDPLRRLGGRSPVSYGLCRSLALPRHCALQSSSRGALPH